jgi:hypothetical protein
MSKLSVQQRGESSASEYEFIGWRGDRRAMLLLDPAGERRVIPLVPPTIGGAWIASLPQDEVPRSVRPQRLLPPPIRFDEREAKALIGFAATHDLLSHATLSGIQAGFVAYAFAQGCADAQLPELWELEYGDALWPKPEDIATLRQRLRKWKAAKRRERDARLAEARALESATVRKVAEVTIRQEYNARLRSSPDGLLLGGHLRHTVESMMQGSELRDVVLHERWARERGFDLAKMNEQCRAFDNQMAATGNKLGALPNQRVLDICRSRVRYVMDFDHLSSPVWLTECKIRSPQTRGEMEDFAKLHPRPMPTRTVSPRSRGSTPADEELAKWPDVIGAKELIRLHIGSKNTVHKAAKSLGLVPVNPGAAQKQYRKSDVLAAIRPKHP